MPSSKFNSIASATQYRKRQSQGGGSGTTSTTTPTPGGSTNWYDSLDWENMKPKDVSSTLLRLTAPVLGKLYSGEGSPNLYDIPELNFSLPNIQDYMAGGSAYQNAYNQLAPSFWDTYSQSVENPLIARFSGSGTLGSPVAGLSGSAMDALLNKRGAAENTISQQVFNAAQQPLLAAYGAETNAAMQRGLKPWEAQLEEYQYPYQILPGIVSGTLPPKVVEQEGGGGGGGFCFLTTACVNKFGLPDDCYQLQTLRAFRDKFMRSIAGGGEMIEKYYKIAPKIVAAISRSGKSKEEYMKVFYEIQIAVGMILTGNNSGALSVYKNMVDRLFRKYIKG